MLTKPFNAKAVLRKWVPLLQLEGWEIGLESFDCAVLERGADGDKTAEVFLNTKNMKATIKYAVHAPTVETDVVHELVHLATAELAAVPQFMANELSPQTRSLAQAWTEGADERLVCRLQRLLQRLGALTDAGG